MSAQKAKDLLLKTAQQLGFSHVGVSKAGFMEPEARRLEAWLNRGFHGKMHYMENHFDKRVDPRKLVPGARSVISLMYNYYSEKKQKDPEAPKISRYAYGEDYHFVIKRKLKELVKIMQKEVGQINGRVFVDSAPVMERDWAMRSGLGWTGKHTLLIRRGAGSYFFLAEIISDLALEPDMPARDHCGTCRRCIEACPTEAISPSGYLLDARKCISYLTIELREEIPPAYRDKLEGWVFGCDICQQVCPWNRFATPHREPAFEPREKLLEMSKREWLELTEEVFKDLFKKTPVKRAGYLKLRNTMELASSQVQNSQKETKKTGK